MYLRTSIKAISLIIIAIILITAAVALIYKPIYSVEYKGEHIGYTQNKTKLQSQINEYMTKGEGNNVAFIEIEEQPKYEMCLLKKGITTNDDEILEAVKSTGTTYYKYYAVTVDNEEKLYLSTLEEAEKTVEELKEKKSTNKDKLGILEKYQTELKEFTTQELAVKELYKAPVTYYSSTGTASASKGVNTSAAKIELGISLIRPTSGTITSRFGSRWGRLHSGLDIGAPKGTPIYAAAGGTVTYSGYNNSGYGNYIIISHGNGIQTLYAHCSELNVTAGTTVSQGQLIGKVGSTGNSTGNHLHFEVRVNGVAQNPQNYVY